MTTEPTQLQSWRSKLNEAEDACFWPGPRPMSSTRWADQLIGRDNDSRKFSDLVRNTSLVVLNGESGVGKSSMLNLGITRRLEKDGFLVLTCRKWATSRAQSELPRGSDAVEDFVAGMLGDQLPAGITRGAGFVADLDDEYGDEAVLVLDQFEGLIRHQPRFYNEVRDWIEDVVKHYDVRVVISLRTEFMHRIGDLKVGPYKRADYRLDRISDPDVVTRIVEAGVRADDSSVEVIEASAVTRIVERWKAAEGGLAWTNVGLLHLQALLYFLWHEYCSSGAITASDIAAAEEALSAVDDAGALFENALARTVGLRLDRCRQVYLEELGGDPTLAEGVASLLTRFPVHLESGGYKVSRESRQLAELTLGRELETLRGLSLDRGQPAGEMFTALAAAVAATPSTEWLDAARTDLAPDDELRAQLTDRVGDEDDHEVTSGPMLGMPPLAVLTEELRRYFFALAWLEQSDIVAPADADGGETMLELVHDGFSRGLKEWAVRNADGPDRILHRLTASIGEVFDWRSLRLSEPSPVAGGSEQGADTFAVHANLRWRSCRVVGMDARRRVFVNCDFRETTFVDCGFEGVTFINCLLDGVSFIGCTIQGETDPALTRDDEDERLLSEDDRRRERERKELLPSFLVAAPKVAATLNHYRDRPVDGAAELVSWTSGGPARPISPRLAEQAHSAKDRGRPPADAPPELASFRFLDWSPQRTGLAMYGGRLSSLMFGECTLRGKVSLRHVAGTSLEFGAQRSGAIELYDVALRGFSISPPVERVQEDEREAEDDERPEDPRIEVSVVDSALQNVWFSTPLRGRARIADSVVWQLFSASSSDEEQGFVVELDDSPHLGLFNAPGVDEHFAVREADLVPGGTYHDTVQSLAQRVDFQSLANLRTQSPVPPEK